MAWPRATAGELGARIRDLRDRAEMQSQQLAAKVGLDPSAMSNIERGKRSVKTEELELIAAALGISPLAILNEDSLLARLPIAPRVQGEAPPDSAAFARLTALAELHELLAEHGIPALPRISDAPRVDTVRWLETAELLAGWAQDKLPSSEHAADRFSELAEGIEMELGIDVLVESAPEQIAGA